MIRIVIVIVTHNPNSGHWVREGREDSSVLLRESASNGDPPTLRGEAEKLKASESVSVSESESMADLLPLVDSEGE